MRKTNKTMFRALLSTLLVLSMLMSMSVPALAEKAVAADKLVQCDTAGVVTAHTAITGVNLPVVFDNNPDYTPISVDAGIFSSGAVVKELTGLTSSNLHISLGAVTNYDYDTVYEIKYRAHYSVVGEGTEIIEEWKSTNLYFKVEAAAVTGAVLSSGSGTFDKYAPADVQTTITWNDATTVTGITANSTSIGTGSYSVTAIDSNTATLTIKEGYLATQSAGSLVLTVDFDKGDVATLTIAITDSTPGPVTSATIAPATGSFDLYASDDVEVTITWNGASTVTDVKAAGTSIGVGSYNVTDIDGDKASLTIKKEYLTTQSTDNLALTIEFDAGDPEVLTIYITDSTPPTISPTCASYDLSNPDDVSTAIEWNSAGSVTDVVYGTTPLTTPDAYVVTGSALTIKSDYLGSLGLSEGNMAEFTISFDVGASVMFTVDIDNNPTLSDNADLKSITVNGDKVNSFDPNKTEYDVELPYGTIMAVIDATPAEEHASVDITQASTLSDSATVLVTAQDTITEKTYTINFTLGAEPNVPVESITVTGTGGATSVEVGNRLQMLAVVLPNDATNQDVDWSIEGGSGDATISTGGLLIANTAGTVIVRATAQDGSGVYDDKEITITGTTSESYSITVQNDGHGTASVNVTSATKDTEITLTATPDSGYHFKEWQAVSDNVTIVNNTFTMPDEAVTIKAIFEESAPDTYSITIQNDGHGTARSNVTSASAGTEITLTATPNRGYHFKRWQVVSGGVTVASNTFTMPNNTVIVKAIFETDSTGGGNNSGEGSSGGSSDRSPTTPTIAPDKKPDQPVIAASSLTPTVDASGKAMITVPQQTVMETINKAIVEAAKQGRTENGIGVSVDVKNPDGTKTLGIVLTQPTLKLLADSKVQQFEINAGLVSLGLNLEALKEIQKQSIGDVTVTLTPATGLSKEAQALIGTRAVYNITLSYIRNGKTMNITNLNNGSATLSIPYTPGQNEAVGYLFGVYVDGKGNAIHIPGSTYDANSGGIILDSNHFSMYGVGYMAPSAKFTDISTHWAKESIDYVVGRGLFGGTSDTTFSPDTAMSRGMLVTALGRLAGADVSGYKTSSFTDVKADSTFLPYIEWAYKKGIISGIGNQQFAPDIVVTREEIAVILQNYAKATDYTLPITREASTFADSSSISSSFKDAVKAMQQAGIMSGKNNGYFDPKGSATRAEAATMLHRYIKLTINPDTAQGWAKNDFGQRMYYKDGKALTGWQTIDGKVYCFDSKGGAYANGWKQNEKCDWYYFWNDGAIVGWWDVGNEISKKRYYFTKDAIMVSGKWLEIDGKWYYFYVDGALAVSTTIDSYKVDGNGARKGK